jgi:rubrerythrin
MSDLLKLENIRKRNGDIRAFPVSSNMIEAKTRKDGWGYIKIAINNQSVFDMFADKLTGILYLVSNEEWEKEKESYKVIDFGEDGKVVVCNQCGMIVEPEEEKEE